jgi:hypothetical protein
MNQSGPDGALAGDGNPVSGQDENKKSGVK